MVPNDRNLLPEAGSVTHEPAERKAPAEYDRIRIIQERGLLSDFDRRLKELFDLSMIQTNLSFEILRA